MCVHGAVLKPTKEVNSAGESRGSRLCGCGSAAGSACSPGATPDTEPGPGFGGRAEHRHLPPAPPGATAALPRH